MLVVILEFDTFGLDQSLVFGALTDLVMFFMLASSLILLPSLLLSQSAALTNEKNKAKTTNAV